MEGEGCQTIRTDLRKPDDDDLHDSGCERSPTTPSPSISESGQSEKSAAARHIITYDRDFLLSRQFAPQSLKVDEESLLWSEDISEIGIYNPSHCYYKPSASKPVTEKQPECFRPLIESGDLRPQRKSFMSGCQMKSSNAGEAGDKANKSNNGSQRRGSESSDRPRSVPTVEGRRVGSGRIIPERSESRSDSRGSTERVAGLTREKPSKPQVGNADKFNNWRKRVAEENQAQSNHASSWEERRPFRESRDHRSGYQGYGKNKYSPDEQPEWFSEDVTQEDKIELKGFDGHHEKTEKKEKRDGEKKKKEKKKNAITEQKPDEILARKEETLPDLNGTDALQFLLTQKPVFTEDILSADSSKPIMIDFDDFMKRQMSEDSEQKDTEVVFPQASSSRSSRWFKKEDGDTQSFEFTQPESIPSYLLGTFGDEMLLDAQASSLMQDLFPPGDLDDDHKLDTCTPPTTDSSTSSGSKILQMLQQSTKAASDTALASPPKPAEEREKNALPPALAKLLGSPVANKPSLPTEYKTLEELEAGIEQVSKAPSTKPATVKYPFAEPSTATQAVPQLDLINQKPSQPEPQPVKDNSEMAAFNKLVGMMKVTGELNQTVPKMPEITNKDTSNPLKKLVGAMPSPSAAPTGILDETLQHTHSRQSTQIAAVPVPQPPLSAPVLPLQQHPPLGSNSPIPLGLSNLATHFAAPTLLPNGAGVINMVHPSLPSAMQPPAFHHAPVNPKLQQTIQQRQKLPSPIMFGAQPPGHIVAPAPIHPVGQAQAPHVGHSQAIRGQPNMPTVSNQIFEQMPAISSIPAAKPAAVASMAFTPTSVIRKIANDKVDERHKQGENTPNTPSYNSQPSSSQQQSLNRRPIVKNTAAPSVAQQMKRMMNEQSEVHARQQHAMYTEQHAAQQPAYQPMNSNVNGFFPQQTHPAAMFNHQPHNLSQGTQQQQVSLGVGSNQLQQQLAFLQQAQQPLLNSIDSTVRQEKRTPADNITKWFCGAELTNQPLPKHVNMLKLEDIEH